MKCKECGLKHKCYDKHSSYWFCDECIDLGFVRKDGTRLGFDGTPIGHHFNETVSILPVETEYRPGICYNTLRNAK